MSDLLTHVNRHGKDGRLKNSGLLLAGLASMFTLTVLIGHDH